MFLKLWMNLYLGALYTSYPYRVYACRLGRTFARVYFHYGEALEQQAEAESFLSLLVPFFGLDRRDLN